MRKLFFAVALAFVSLASTAQNLSLNPSTPPEFRSMTFALGKTRINSVLLSLNHVIRHRSTVYHTIRHKPLHNIPLMQGFLQLSVIL